MASGFHDRQGHDCQPSDKKGLGYHLIPTASGLCEHSLQKAGENPLHTRLRDLWKQYRDDGMIESMTNTMPLMRVLPIETILPDKSHILPYEAVPNLIRVSGRLPFITEVAE